MRYTPRATIILTRRWVDQIHRSRFLAFCLAGTLGFLADVAVLETVRPWLGLYAGRLVSFGVAVTVTWLINRHLAFGDRRSAAWVREWFRYVSANALGAIANYASYAGLVAGVAICAAYPASAVAAGSIAGLLFNYSASHLIVFQRGAGPRDPDRP